MIVASMTAIVTNARIRPVMPGVGLTGVMTAAKAVVKRRVACLNGYKAASL
ncbi:hypothetical protein ACXIVK_37675 [Paraburkholderia caledonica]